jgi:hypothetical protein
LLPPETAFTEAGPQVFGYRLARPGEGSASERTAGENAKAYIEGLIGRDNDTGPRWARWYVDEGDSCGQPFIKRPQGKLLDAALRRGDHVIVAQVTDAFHHGRRGRWGLLTLVDRWQRRGVTMHIVEFRLDSSTETGQRVLSGLQAVKDMALEHQIFHNVYDLMELPQVVDIQTWSEGYVYEHWSLDRVVPWGRSFAEYRQMFATILRACARPLQQLTDTLRSPNQVRTAPRRRDCELMN